MKQIIKYCLGCLLFAATIVAMVSCSNDDDSSDLYSAIYPKSVTIDLSTDLQRYIYVDATGTKVLPLIKGETVTLGYTILPEDITFSEVNWTSSNVSVATVDQNGQVVAVSGDGIGYSIVQVAPSVFYSGSNIFGTLKIVVSDTLVPAQSITVSSASDEVFAGETLQLSASIFPENATYKTVKWNSSDESIATVDLNGLVTGQTNNEASATVTITATSLDGAQIVGSTQITVLRNIEPEEVYIDQKYAVDNGYYCAIGQQILTLSYTTVPVDCTKSKIIWSSSDASIATVNANVVTFNATGVFGDVTITATCPETGNRSSIKLHLAEGLVRELFHDANYSWYHTGTASHSWEYGKIAMTTYTVNATRQRGDFKCYRANTFLHAGYYPIFAVRMDDVLDYAAVTARNITLDTASGSCNGITYSGGLNGNNNKWLNDYQCSDNSHVFIYDLSTQAWATGGVLSTTSLATFPTIQFKYADINGPTAPITYNVYWVQTFKTIEDVKAYIISEGLTYTVIK